MNTEPNMDSELRRRMLTYYDERATEYEEAYTLGTGTASIPDPQVFKVEARVLAGIVGQIGHGRIMDLACGTAYWLPHYAPLCSHITLFDQSARMLAEARTKADRLGLLDRCTFVQGDFFEQQFGRDDVYDTVLVGFFMSHLSGEQEPVLFDALRTLLAAGGRFLILDSAWSAERAKVNAKTERQQRGLNDGTSFEIYKRYCDRDDISRWSQSYDVKLRIEHFGPAFYAVSGAFEPANVSS
jgi:demethylmenaquinone methyltransferase/2-methoxy-6-polyprenyl-1,4-benzoquinol methylase